MSRATVLTASQLGQGQFHRAMLILMLAPVLIFAACSGGDDNGGGGGTNTTNNPPPGGSGATQNAYVGLGASQIQAYKLDANGNFTAVGPAIATGTNPHHVNVDPAGRFVYVSNHDSSFVSGWRINQDASLTPINPAPGSPVTGPELTEVGPHWSVLDQTGQFLYVVAGTGASTLRAYRVNQTPGNDLGVLTFITGQSFPVGTHAHNVAISPNNQFIYVASDDSGELRAFSRNTTTGDLTAQGVTPLPGVEAVAVDSQNKFVFASYPNAIDVYSIGANGALTKITPVGTFDTNRLGQGSGPHSIALHPSGQTLYIAYLFSNTVGVWRTDPATGVLTEIQTPPAPTGSQPLAEPNQVIVHPNGRFVFAVDTNFDQISRFPVNADGTLGTAALIPAGDGPQTIGTTKF